MLLDVQNLSVAFGSGDHAGRAVDDVSFSIDKGEIVAIVGESGSGKSVSAMAVMGLLASPPAQVGGAIHFDGQNLTRLDAEALRMIRGRRIGMIFQEPMTSLNPLLTIGRQICEGMQLHLGLSRDHARKRAVELLTMVGISEPARRLKQYPHHFSGGMRQRVMIAIALACEPELIIADEPTTALDVTIQAQILQLMKALTDRFGVALALITHDLGIVARYADRVNVMYAGRIVEAADTHTLFANPCHPYTVGLLASLPRLDTHASGRLPSIGGQPPAPGEVGAGCAFRARCPHAIEACAAGRPPLQSVATAHRSACLRAAELHHLIDARSTT